MRHKILITGGGGFIGTQVAWELHNAGHTVTIVDRNPPVHPFPNIYRVADYLDFLIKDEAKYDTIVHLAAQATVPDSLKYPELYEENNVVKLKCLLDCMVSKKIKNIIFSSSSTVYGYQTGRTPLVETDPYNPTHPYGDTKVRGELLIKEYADAGKINYIIFRIFAAAGADPNGKFGYVKNPATHVVPALCECLLRPGPFTIYGNDFDTRDGTSIRDYVHMADISRAYKSAIDFIDASQYNEVFNLGGRSGGVTLLELVQEAKEATGIDIPVILKDRRPGDVGLLTADTRKADYLLNWKPGYTIKQILLHAYNWRANYEANN